MTLYKGRVRGPIFKRIFHWGPRGVNPEHYGLTVVRFED
jgi:hypothetical protein